jgi:hypothetical protein
MGQSAGFSDKRFLNRCHGAFSVHYWLYPVFYLNLDPEFLPDVNPGSEIGCDSLG